MSDHLTIEQRHKNMAAVKSKDTKPEMVVRKYLWSRGFRYRVNNPRLPGHPDIVLRKYRTCIFVNGCFWHHHTGCKRATVPSTNPAFWADKFTRNRIRDAAAVRTLRRMGWRVAVVWECETKNVDRVTARLAKVLEARRVDVAEALDHRRIGVDVSQTGRGR